GRAKCSANLCGANRSTPLLAPDPLPSDRPGPATLVPAPHAPALADHRLAGHRNRVLERMPDQLRRAGRSGGGGSVGGCGVVVGATLCGAASAGAAPGCGATPTSLR